MTVLDLLDPIALTTMLSGVDGPSPAMVERVTSAGFFAWQEAAKTARGCLHPVRLAGSVHSVDASTGEILSTHSTVDRPDGVIYTACGTRRESLCPACAHTYRYDTYHLVRAGLAGGKTVPESVAFHPAVFATFTAPSFGLVHSGPAHAHTVPYPCRPRRDKPVCPHGRALYCARRHTPDDPTRGRPFCLDCYDHDHHAVWNGFVPALWDRTMTRLRQLLTAEFGCKLARVRYVKVAEFQARGVVHLHAILRLDAWSDDPATIAPPVPEATAGTLAKLVTRAAAEAHYVTPPHPARLDGWPVLWGGHGKHVYADVRPLPRGLDSDGLTEQHVAGYLAKYATKATEPAGLVLPRLDDVTVDRYADPDGNHLARLIASCWRLGGPLLDADPRALVDTDFARLRRGAHMLGFAGHFSSKSHRYSVTLGALRAARRPDANPHPTGPEHDVDDQTDHATQTATVLLVNDLRAIGFGWLTPADEHLATLAADTARSH